MKVFFAKLFSKASSKGFWIIFLLVIVLIVLVPVLSSCPMSARFFADLFSSTSLRNIAYDSMNSGNNNGWYSVAAYALGTILILGVFVPLVTNRMRTLGDRYLNGTINNVSSI